MTKVILAALWLAGVLVAPMTAHAMTLEEYIAQSNPGEAQQIAAAIYDKARLYHVDPLLMASVIEVESGFNPRAVSPVGAIGLTQLMPGTAQEMGVNPYNIDANIDGGTHYLKLMFERNADKGPYQVNYALASYNAGYSAVDRQIPSYTYGYISDVGKTYTRLRRSITPNETITANHNPKNTRLRERLLQLQRSGVLAAIGGNSAMKAISAPGRPAPAPKPAPAEDSIFFRL